MKRIALLMAMCLICSLSFGQTRTFHNLKVKGKVQLGDTVLVDSLKIVNDTVNLYYSTGELTGSKVTLKNAKVRGWIKFGVNGDEIDSIKLESDTLRFYVGSTRYSFVKAIKNE